MKTVSKRELNQQTARVLSEVTPGESVVVTERGVPKWRIEAVQTHSDPIRQLEREGRITPAKLDPRPWSAVEERRRYTPTDVDALLNDMRGDR